jgi:protein ImuA
MNFRAADLPVALATVVRAPRPGLVPFAAGAAADAPRLAAGQVHEATGSARATFAVALAGSIPQQGPQDGPVLWIRPAWSPDRLHPDGMRPLVDPGRFLFVDAPRDADLLWCMEEALRSGQVPLVIADLPAVPGLTAVRRLTLAAEAGAALPGAAGCMAPSGLILTPGQGGAPGVETRWRMDADHAAAPGWRLERQRARMVPPAAFRVVPGQDGRLRIDADRASGAGQGAEGQGALPPGPTGAGLPPEVRGHA